MDFLLCFAVFPIFFAGIMCVRCHDLGCALGFSAAAAVLSVCGLMWICQFGNILADICIFFAVFFSALLYSLNRHEIFGWRNNWLLRTNKLHFLLFALAFVGGLCHHIVSSIILCFSFGTMLTLSGRKASDGLMPVFIAFILMLCGLFCPFPHILYPYMCIVICALCLVSAFFHLLPASEFICSGIHNKIIYCLFVFLTYYYTISIS